MPRNGIKAAREQRKWKANQKYVETHGKWIINTSHKLGSVRPIDLVSRNPDRLREFESKEAAVAFEEECHQEAEKLKAAGKDWSHYRYIPRKQLTIQAKLLEESGKPREEHPAAGASEPAPRKCVRLLRKFAAKDAVCDSPNPALNVEARCAVGELTDAGFYPTMGNEMATCVAAAAQRGKRRRETWNNLP